LKYVESVELVRNQLGTESVGSAWLASHVESLVQLAEKMLGDAHCCLTYIPINPSSPLSESFRFVMNGIVM
jgi:hypothetical protein